MSSALSVRLQGRAMVAGLAAAGAADAVFKMESAESERLNTRAVCHLVSSSRHGGRARRGAVTGACGACAAKRAIAIRNGQCEPP
jgi:hypothetical protein